MPSDSGSDYDFHPGTGRITPVQAEFHRKNRTKISARAALMQSGLDLCRSGGVVLSSSERNKTHRPAPFATETARIAFFHIGNINCHLIKSLLRVPLKRDYCVPCRFGVLGAPGRAGQHTTKSKKRRPDQIGSGDGEKLDIKKPPGSLQAARDYFFVQAIRIRMGSSKTNSKVIV